MAGGGLGRAVLGGILFGGVGAIVGGITGAGRIKQVCRSMKLSVSLKNAHVNVAYIHFISTEVKTGGFIYRTAQDCSQRCSSLLETILDENRSMELTAEYNSTQVYSTADEILKFKALLDQGILTQEEFQAKKKELLGL